mgnify:CR=1 FL=1
MTTERELFEQWAYSKKWNIFRVRDKGIDRDVDDFVDGAWHGWQASANHQGYKLVPLEPTEEMINAAINVVVDEGSYERMYKAMIGAAK